MLYSRNGNVILGNLLNVLKAFRNDEKLRRQQGSSPNAEREAG